MNRILHILFFFLFLFNCTNVLSNTIKEINIKGNKRLSNNTIIVLSNLSVGEETNNERLNESLKKLYETNFFQDVSIKFENDILEIVVIENPIIEDIEIRGISHEPTIKNILSSISLKIRSSYNESYLNNDLILIKNLLKRSGYYFSKVNSSILSNQSNNSIRLIIDIDQGSKAKIKEISFIGDRIFKEKKLKSIISSEEHKFWKFISNKVYVDQNRIDFDSRLLTNFYKNQGYYKVEILSSFAEITSKDNFKITFNIDSGNKYYFNELDLKIPIDYNKNDFEDINRLFNKLRGKEYSINALSEILDKIDLIASTNSYDFITANVTDRVVENNKLNFIFEILDSEKFYVEKINLRGNNTTIEEVIRNKFIIDEGDPLNQLLFNKSINNIKSSGLFKNVDSIIKNGSSDNLKIIDIIVEEQPTGEISLGAGYGTSGTAIGGGIKEKNFLGKGINLNTNLEISEESVKGQFIYSKPNFAYTDNTLFASIRSTNSDFLSTYGYEISDLGVSVGTKFEQYENIFFSPEIDVSIEKLETNSTASSNLKKQEGNYEDVYFKYSIDQDLRDSSFDPTRGNITTFYQEVPIVSGNNELINTFSFTQYKTLSKINNTIGKASIFLKSANSLSDENVRISKRAQIPYSRLRGFERGKVGPKDGDDYIGGNYVAALNLSTNLPSIMSTVDIIDFNYFIDVANVWGVDYSSQVDDSNTIRSSTGLGIDMLTPVGPLSFSFSKPITKKSSDKTETFRFNLGTTF
jgi:outer membrane protein insertion porin family